jgi:hypothetical protein
MSEIPHLPWFIRSRPLDDGQAVIENGTHEGVNIAVCEWHIAEYIVDALNRRYAESPSVAEAVEKEREACAVVCDKLAADCLNGSDSQLKARECAATIRARRD